MEFSFLKGNNLVRMDDLESPTMIPSVDLRTVGSSAPSLNSLMYEATPSSSESQEHLQTLQISPNAIAAKAPDVPFLQASAMLPRPAPQIMPPPKPKIRAKIALDKGYSQMDWLKLTQTKSDLAGLKGRSSRRLISMEEVKLHRTDEDAWTVLRGLVYNISPYLRFHPGGRDMLMKGAGKDCTSLFNKYHAWVNAEFLLEKCLVGVLDMEPQAGRGGGK